MSKIELLSDISNSALVQTVTGALEAALKTAKKDEFTKAFIILVDEHGIIHWECSNMDDKERIAFLEMTKTLIIRDLYPQRGINT